MQAVDPDGNIAYCLFDISPGLNLKTRFGYEILS